MRPPSIMPCPWRFRSSSIGRSGAPEYYGRRKFMIAGRPRLLRHATALGCLVGAAACHRATPPGTVQPTPVLLQGDSLRLRIVLDKPSRSDLEPQITFRATSPGRRGSIIVRPPVGGTSITLAGVRPGDYTVEARLVGYEAIPKDVRLGSVGRPELVLPLYYAPTWPPFLLVGPGFTSTVSGQARCVEPAARLPEDLTIFARRTASDAAAAQAKVGSAGDYAVPGLSIETKWRLEARSRHRVVGVRPVDTQQLATVANVVIFVSCEKAE